MSAVTSMKPGSEQSPVSESPKRKGLDTMGKCILAFASVIALSAVIACAVFAPIALVMVIPVAVGGLAIAYDMLNPVQYSPLAREELAERVIMFF